MAYTGSDGGVFLPRKGGGRVIIFFFLSILGIGGCETGSMKTRHRASVQSKL